MKRKRSVWTGRDVVQYTERYVKGYEKEWIPEEDQTLNIAYMGISVHVWVLNKLRSDLRTSDIILYALRRDMRQAYNLLKIDELSRDEIIDYMCEHYEQYMFEFFRFKIPEHLFTRRRCSMLIKSGKDGCWAIRKPMTTNMLIQCIEQHGPRIVQYVNRLSVSVSICVIQHVNETHELKNFLYAFPRHAKVYSEMVKRFPESLYMVPAENRTMDICLDALKYGGGNLFILHHIPPYVQTRTFYFKARDIFNGNILDCMPHNMRCWMGTHYIRLVLERFGFCKYVSKYAATFLIP